MSLAFIATGKYWVNNHAHILKPQDGNLKYWCEVLEAHDYTTECSGSAQPKLTAEALNAIKIPLPPLDERSQISEFIELQTKVLAELTEKSKNSIKLMNEHRQALITAAVTGKIDVRGLVTDEEVAALDAESEVETTEEDLTSEVAEDTYITEEE